MNSDGFFETSEWGWTPLVALRPLSWTLLVALKPQNYTLLVVLRPQSGVDSAGSAET